MLSLLYLYVSGRASCLCKLGVAPYKIDSHCICKEWEGETVALQDKAAAVWLIELKSDTVQQLRSPLGVIRPLTLLIITPHLPLASKSLQSRLLTIKIYHMVSNNIICTRSYQNPCCVD